MTTDRQQRTTATQSRPGTFDLYQKITAIPMTEPAAIEPRSADASRVDVGFVDLVFWAVIVASLALGFWA